MYFSSEIGKGFIISDDEEVTGVISVRNTLRKKIKGKIRKNSESKMDTLSRRAKRKQMKQKNVPNFLFVNKPHFSSNSSLEIAPQDDFPTFPEFPHELQKEDVSDRRYKSETMLRSFSRYFSSYQRMLFLPTIAGVSFTGPPASSPLLTGGWVEEQEDNL